MDSGVRRPTLRSIQRSRCWAATFGHSRFRRARSRTSSTPRRPRLRPQPSVELFDTIVEGTRRVLEFARVAGAGRFLFTSSGAIYGRQPADLTHFPRTILAAPIHRRYARVCRGQARGRDAVRRSCERQRSSQRLRVASRSSVPTCLSTLTSRSATSSGTRWRVAPLRITGDGTRSARTFTRSDLAIWLWTILLHGHPLRAYNVGAPDARPISSIAEIVFALHAPASRGGRHATAPV